MKRPLLFATSSLVAVLLLAGCGGSPAAEAGASTLQATETNGETNDLWGSLATDDEKSTDVHKLPQRSFCQLIESPREKRYNTSYNDKASFSLNG